MKSKLFTLLLLFFAIGMRAADGGWSGSNISWTLDDNGVLIINGKGDMKSYDGPSLPPWHSYSSSIKSVIIKNGVTSIGNYAFCKCIGLTTVTIGTSVTSIGDCAFEGCSGLTTVNIPNSVTSIETRAFHGCM